MWCRQPLLYGGRRGFETAARSDSLAAAAPLVGTDRYTLDRSLRGLEQALGGALFDRSGPSQPHQLTALGRQLLDQMGDHRGATASRVEASAAGRVVRCCSSQGLVGGLS